MSDSNSVPRETLPEPLTSDEEKFFVELMDRLAFWKRNLPLQVFFAWLRNFYANSAECAVLRNNDGVIEILLKQRDADDPFYSLMWHMPGTICLPGRNLKKMVKLCYAKEIFEENPVLSDKIAERAEFVHLWDRLDEPRGQTWQFLHVVELTHDECLEIKRGRFFGLHELPGNLVKSHIRMTDWLRANIDTLPKNLVG